MKLFGIGLLIAGSLTGIMWKHTIRVQTNVAPGNYKVDTLATNLTVPWDIVFLPDSTMLFTERSGKVRIFRHEQLLPKPALVISDADLTKKMGLLGMCLHPGFNANRFVYLAVNYRKEGQAFLKIARYYFSGDTLISPVTILDTIYASPNHTGCRLRFGPDKKLYITTGDADRPVLAQDLKSLNGKILRVNDDGSIPADNPFVGIDTARKEIWSYGHRNTQGIDFDPVTAQLYNSEHGPTGGDEINFIQKGYNYGWPVIHHQHSRKGMEMPLMEFTPSIGPSQLTFYNSDVFPFLKNKLLLACLRGEKIMTFSLQGKTIIEEENLLPSGYGRIRALTMGPDGYIYFSTSQNDPPEGKPSPGYDMLLRLRSVVSSHSTERRSANKTINVVAGKKPDATTTNYLQLCASCHGTNMEGTERAKSMLDGEWEFGAGKRNIIKSIRNGVIEKGMPAWEGTLTQKEIEAQAQFIISTARKNRK